MSRVMVDTASIPCRGCNVPTLVRVDGKPGHWACVENGTEPPAVTDIKLRFLAVLESSTHQPRRKHEGRMAGPYWRPPLPDVMDVVQTSTWTWKRPYDGPTAVLDRSGAWIAAAASVDIAHGPLDHTGPGDFTGRPGLYKMPWFEWHEEHVPHPMGGVVTITPDGGGVPYAWVPHTRAALLAQLADAGRWPDAFSLDSYTGAPARLSKWTEHVSGIRSLALRKYGRESEQYGQVKIAFSQAVALMLGSKEPGKSRTWKCGVHRPDWALSIQDLAAVTLWRWADDCAAVAREHKRPELAPVAMRNIDELVLPVDAVDLVTTQERPGGRPPLKLDPTGIKLGTFKIKATEA